MCGLVGIISKRENGFFQPDIQLFKRLLYTNAIRGFDSTGAFCVTNDGNLESIKRVGYPTNLLISKEWEEFQNTAWGKGRILIGHNRKATMGKVDSSTAHPFIANHTALVHNGFISNNFKLKEQYKIESNVDSETICKLFNKIPSINKVITSLDGAFAMIWYNAKEKKLHLTRNDRRPLHFFETKTSWIIASEFDHLNWLIGRESDKDFEILNKYYVAENTYITFDINNLSNMKITAVRKTKKKKEETKTNLIVYNQSNQETKKTNFYSNQVSIDLYVSPKDTNITFTNHIPIANEKIDLIATSYTEINKDEVIVTGQALYNKDIRFKYKCTEETLEDLLGEDYIEGTVRKVITRNNQTLIAVEDLKPKTYVQYQNETISELLHNTIHRCNKCNTLLNRGDALWTQLEIGKEITDIQAICQACQLKEYNVN